MNIHTLSRKQIRNIVIAVIPLAVCLTLILVTPSQSESEHIAAQERRK